MKLFNFKTRKYSISDDEARRLTALFLDGATSIDEEKLLYAYYRATRIAYDLLQYKDMFCWYDALSNPDERKNAIAKSRGLIAASITIAVLVTISLFSIKTIDTEVCDIYAGSYIIRDGKKITDISKILPELRRADHIADSTMTAISNESPDNIEHEAITSAIASINDPQIREMLLADLSL